MHKYIEAPTIGRLENQTAKRFYQLCAGVGTAPIWRARAGAAGRGARAQRGDERRAYQGFSLAIPYVTAPPPASG